jgi:hypothetical protein
MGYITKVLKPPAAQNSRLYDIEYELGARGLSLRAPFPHQLNFGKA